MSDLQCPATFHVLGPGCTPGRWDLVHGAPIVAVHAGSGRAVEAGADAASLDESRPLDVVLVELSDLYRGVHVVVLPTTAAAPLRGEDDEVVVRVDADGVAVDRPDPA